VGEKGEIQSARVWFGGGDDNVPSDQAESCTQRGKKDNRENEENDTLSFGKSSYSSYPITFSRIEDGKP